MQLSRWVRPSLRRQKGGRSGGERSGLVRTDHARDAGYTLIEVTIAMAIFALVATFMTQLLAGGLRGVLLGKRREIATQEANGVIEVARSLAYDAIGIVQTDSTIDSDPAITIQNGDKSYRSAATWEPLIWATNATDHPFDPHVDAVTRGSTSLERYIYVTGVDSNGDDEIDLKRISVRVTWDESETAAVKNEVRAQTLVNESGLISGSASPLSATAVSNSGTLSVKSARGDYAQLQDAELPTDPVTLALPTTTGTSKYRAVSDVNCLATSTALSGSDATYGGHSVTVTADDDATSATVSQPAAQTYSGSPADQINGADDVDDVLLETTLSSPVSCSATAEDGDGNAPSDDGLPYEKGTGSAPGTLNFVEDLSELGLPSTTLYAATTQTSPITQEIDHQSVSGVREVLASATGALGPLNVLKIGGVFEDGLVRVDALSYTASVRGAEGTPSAAPAVNAPVITFRVYDVGQEVAGCESRSGDYCLLSVDPSAADFTGLSINYEHNVIHNDGDTDLIYEVHVNVLPPAKDPIAGVTGANGEKRWTAEYTPIAISTRLQSELTVDPELGTKVVMTDTKVDLNLGSVKAEACGGLSCL